ncbi:MAG TPA: biotin--[acetyl-CoA-carboxylase] ligase [Allosphingosinicella sp.]|nr:biotin--[acetyl-CoA-carboxylase] ligase [Allosphingosinicella sp.]
MFQTVEATGSTNDDVVALARDGAAEGLWLRADRQTGGKGRQGREWESPPGNLYASTLVRLRPGDPPAPTLALVAAVALHETVCAFAGGVEIAIKWPNDLTAFGAKLSGILLERLGDEIAVGFGVNLAAHPDATARPATSLAALGAGAPDPAQFLDALAGSFARWLGRWRSEGLTPIRAAWLSAAHPSGTALSTHTASGGLIEGLFDGLDESGALRLRLADGAVQIIHAGDVFLI